MTQSDKDTSEHREGPVSPETGSHPAIQFQQIPIVRGPLTNFNEMRPRILADVIKDTAAEISDSSLEWMLSEAHYLERERLKRQKRLSIEFLATLPRRKGDLALWSDVRSGLARRSTEVDRRELLNLVLDHYAEEIGGHFSERIYWSATRLVPYSFNWLLNAASVRRFLPWGMTEALTTRLRILGEIPTLQKLAKKGTILLVPTHQSNIDSLLIGYVIYLMGLPPFCYGAGLNLFANPVLGFFMSNLGAYTVDRQKNNRIYKSVLKNYSTRVLREGVHSIFFPGGGRSRSGAIESHLKLGLLGTGLQAQIHKLREGHEKPNVYVVPMVTSYHFVLEASSLVEQYLRDIGKHRFFRTSREETLPLAATARFFWKLFASRTGLTVNIGSPLDIFGNPVDEEGRSIGPNGTTIDPRQWLTTAGELRSEPQRDEEYTKRLGRKLVERYYRENTVLSSHLVAFAFLQSLRRKYPDLDLFRFLRLTEPQRSLPFDQFLAEAAEIHGRVREMADRGGLKLSSELQTSNTESWVRDGMANLGVFHGAAVVREREGVVWTEDMNLLYFYRNRLSGYGLSLLSERLARRGPGEFDEKGFLA